MFLDTVLSSFSTSSPLIIIILWVGYNYYNLSNLSKVTHILCILNSKSSFSKVHLKTPSVYSCVDTLTFVEATWPNSALVHTIGIWKSQMQISLWSRSSGGLPKWLSGKESTCQCRRHTRDVSSIPGLGRSPGRGNGNPLQYSCLENSMERGTWRAIVHRVAKGQTWLRTHVCKIQSLCYY